MQLVKEHNYFYTKQPKIPLSHIHTNKTIKSKKDHTHLPRSLFRSQSQLRFPLLLHFYPSALTYHPKKTLLPLSHLMP
ncbi:uncharacterized protein DS421_8g243490 [Arachis hypogaea]|nr:uncharacterized protein DS421_8g243490 [Arachis hypogaea]